SGAPPRPSRDLERASWRARLARSASIGGRGDSAPGGRIDAKLTEAEQDMNSNPRDPSNANESSAELEATSHDATGPESGPSGEGERRPAAGEERESTPAAALRALGDEELV